jgi:O-antigen/teichoic acid export membrane protein
VLNWLVKRILTYFDTPTARSSAFFYFSSIFASFFRYLFHLILLRLLAPSEYGEFSSYLSLIYILGIPTIIVSNVVVKYVSDFRGRGDDVSINQLFYFLLYKLSFITFPLGLLLIIFSTPLALLFKAHSLAFVVLGVSMFISVFQTIIGSYVFAYQKIVFVTIIGFVNVIVNILLAVIFIKLGFGATGVIVAQILAGILTTIVSIFQIYKVIFPRINFKSIPNFNFFGFIGYSFIYAVGTSMLISTDIILVRIFFDSHISGLYSSLIILGRMILFGLTPLISLVFPISAHRHAKSYKTNSIFAKLGLVILFFGLGAASIYSIFSDFIVSKMSLAYIESAIWLPYVAFGMAFFAFSQFIISYLMATSRPQASILLLVATIVQPVLIYVLRGSFDNVIFGNFGLQFTLFLMLSLYVIGEYFFSRFKIRKS